ncbi:MAG: Eco57I restriction-modification methylase domain-containing protein [Parabacteroides sp.]
MTTSSYNPDVLTCLANLSNDEVFTPPQVVNQMLNLLPASLWSDPNARFLDPVSKTGVFLREIAKRLMAGLADQIPDVQERANHIFSQQLYALAITELTALLSRRSVYCSKRANSDYSVCTTFTDEQGNIRYTPMRHTWENGRCRYCGASQEVYARGETLESHAYQFIHTTNPNQIFNMKFDVIIGNPPYQLSDGGNGASAKPIYHLFVEQAMKLNPRYLVMIIPARWFAGGKGLDEFREKMLNDERIKKLVDYFDSQECFPGIDLSGGVCYFLWQKDHNGNCEVKTIRNGKTSIMQRKLLEKSNHTFIRFNEAISILHKIKKIHSSTIDSLISSRKPFGIATNAPIKKTASTNTVKIFAYPNNGYIEKTDITSNINWVSKYKVFISYAYGERGDFPYLVIGKPFIGEPNTCCSETYLLIGPFLDEKQTMNVISYIKTKFFRFLVLLRKNTQHATSKVYSFVPLQDFNEPWTDEKLYKKYGLTEEEIAFIESMIRPME